MAIKLNPLSAMSPVNNIAPVTPNDSSNLPNPGRLCIAEGGDVALVDGGGNSVTVTLPAGWHPVYVVKVLSTGTTATGISVGY